MKHLYAFDLPVPYKGLTLYPVTMKDYYIFSALVQCLMLERAADPNPMVALTMTRLDYLLYTSPLENINGKQSFSSDSNTSRFVALMSLITKDFSDDFSISFGRNKSGKTIFIIRDVEYDNSDFEKLREIISEQNYISLPNENIQKNVRDAIEESRRYKEKLRGSKIASLEDQMVALSLFSGISLDSIYGMTVRKFILSIQRATHMIYQEAYLQASLSGMVEFKDKSILKGWLSEIEDNQENADVTMDVENIQSKISGS